MTSTAVSTTLSEPIEHWAEVKPDAEALTYGDRHWTWAQLRDRVRRVTGGLLAEGLRHGDRVAFLDKNHPACVEVTLGASRLGAANAVVNWRMSGDELDYVLNDSGATVLFAGAELLPVLESIRDKLTAVRKVIVVGEAEGMPDQYEAWLAAAEPAETATDVRRDDPALVLYTSGTTGRPKGALLTQRGLIAHTRTTVSWLPVDDDSRNLVAMPLFHVGGSSYVLVGLYAGIPTTMLRELEPTALFASIAGGATHAFLVPAVIAGVAAAGEQAMAALGRLRYLIYGASPMPLPLLRKVLDAWPRMRFIQVYGLTELCGVISTLLPDAHRAGRTEWLTSAGTVVPGAELRVVDPATGADAAAGEPGELWFRSSQTMAGYLNKPEATADTITEDGWLRTGDVGKVDQDGYIYVIDRVKDMIITGGENVYSPEVERVLAEHPAVGDVAVIGVPDDRWGESIKAVVTPEPGQTVDEAELIAYCRDRLAHYKCPRTVDVLDELPRNPTGKILKKVLRQPYWADRDRQV